MFYQYNFKVNSIIICLKHNISYFLSQLHTQSYLFMSIQANQLTKAIHIAIMANVISLKGSEDSKNESWIR